MFVPPGGARASGQLDGHAPRLPKLVPGGGARTAGIEAQRGEALEQAPHRDARLDLGQCGAEAEVAPKAEGGVP